MIFSILTALLMTISTIVLSITRVFGGRWRGRRFSTKRSRVLKKLSDKLADALKTLVGKAMGFVSEYTWILIVFVAGLIGAWLMQRVLRKQAGKK